MDRPYYREIFTPQIENPIFVEGLPGFGNVGKIAARILIQFTGAKLFGELYSPSFPDYVLVNAKGICRPPRYEFYAASLEKKNFIILIGDTQPSVDDVLAHYELCDKILDIIAKYNPKLVITIGGVPTPEPKGEVYVAATSSKLVAEVAEKGALIYRRGRIMGATGLVLGLAKTRGMDGICLLGATLGTKADRGSAFTVFKFLMRFLGADVREGM